MSELNHVPRRPLIAAFLSLCCGPLGQLYAGRGKRFVTLAVVTLVLMIVAAPIALWIPGGHVSFKLLMFAFACWPVFLIVDAFQCSRKARQQRLHWYQRWWLYPLVFLAYLGPVSLISELRTAFIAEAFLIPAGSMHPTITPGDRILVNKLGSRDDAIDYGNVVAYYSKGPGSPMYVTRVVAIEGNTIEIRNESVFVNGKQISEPYAAFDGDLPTYPNMVNMQPVVVPPRHFFALSDSRRRSMDSRMLGPVPIDYFQGVASRIFWSRPRQIDFSVSPENSQIGAIAWERIGMPIR